MIEKRKLNNKDIEEFVALRTEMLLADASIEYDKGEIIKQTEKYVKENINNYLYIFGIFDNKQLVSMAAMETIKRLPTPIKGNVNSKIGYICSVYTKPEYRKNGYAKQLLNDILEYANQLGITRFKLSTHNPEAIRIYESLGFKMDSKAMIKQ